MRRRERDAIASFEVESSRREPRPSGGIGGHQSVYLRDALLAPREMMLDMCFWNCLYAVSCGYALNAIRTLSR